MAAAIEIKVPDIGDFEDVEVVEILVAKGDRVAVEDSLVSIESDKATMEIPSPVAGTVDEVRVALGGHRAPREIEGDLVSLHDVLAVAHARVALADDLLALAAVDRLAAAGSPVALHHLGDDPYEQEDRVGHEPEQVARLADLIGEWKAGTGIS